MADEDLPLSAEARFVEVLAELPAVERSALALREIGGLDAQEIAERLGTDAVTARKLLERARGAVRTSRACGRRGIAALIRPAGEPGTTATAVEPPPLPAPPPPKLP